MTRVLLLIACGLFFLELVELHPQGFPFYYHQPRDQFRAIRGAPTENVVRKDFYIHEIPEEVLQDYIQEDMRLMMQRRQREQFELDRFVLKMYEEFRKRERDGTLNKFRLI